MTTNLSVTASFAVGATTTTTTNIASNVNPAEFGQNATITARITRTSGNSVVTGGTVTFRDGTTVVAGPTALGVVLQTVK